jgi:hypothetical protein
VVLAHSFTPPVGHHKKKGATGTIFVSVIFRPFEHVDKACFRMVSGAKDKGAVLETAGDAVKTIGVGVIECASACASVVCRCCCAGGWRTLLYLTTFAPQPFEIVCICLCKCVCECVSK